MAAAAPNGTSKVLLESEEYEVLCVDISDESAHPEEINQTASLIRGIAAAIRQRGYQPGGFNACVVSDVHGGGFAGTIQAFVPAENVESFRQDIDAVLGEGSCRVLQIRPYGGIVIA